MTKTSNSLDGIATPQPNFTEKEVLAVLSEQYGLEGGLSQLVSERDQNFRLVTPDRKTFAVKIASAAEPAVITEFQIQALLHLEKSGCLVPVPRVLATKRGTVSTSITAGTTRHVLRVVSFLAGTPVEGQSPTPELTFMLGEGLARLDQALGSFSHEGESQVLLWDMQRAGELRELMPIIPDRELRRLVVECLDVFEDNVVPKFSSLRTQVIHNDLNPGNVLVAESGPPALAGIIDFGDMVRAPLIVDVAIAASYLRPNESESLEALAAFVSGFDSVSPLEQDERELLYDLIRMRLATSITILHWRRTLRPDSDPYLQKWLTDCGPEKFLRRLTAKARADFENRVFAV